MNRCPECGAPLAAVAPPPDRSWLTFTEPRPTRPSPMRPAEWRRRDDAFIVGVGATALIVAAVVLLVTGALT